MINCYTRTAKETPYRSTLRDPQGKADPAIGAGHCNPLRQGLRNGILKVGKNREDLILSGVDLVTFASNKNKPYSEAIFYINEISVHSPCVVAPSSIMVQENTGKETRHIKRHKENRGPCRHRNGMPKNPLRLVSFTPGSQRMVSNFNKLNYDYDSFQSYNDITPF
ncbi:hypothetical protein U3516DRAFT_790024 [Neocallimastix sp. 'constans']